MSEDTSEPCQIEYVKLTTPRIYSKLESNNKPYITIHRPISHIDINIQDIELVDSVRQQTNKRCTCYHPPLLRTCPHSPLSSP